MAKKRTTISRGANRATQVRAQRKDGWTPDLRARFLTELSETANLAGSCRAVGKDRAGLAALRKRDAGFNADYEAALCEAYAKLELVMLERALTGSEKIVTRRDGSEERMRVYSDVLGLTLLRVHRDTVRSARARGADLEPIDAVRARVEQRLARLNKRLGGEG